MIEPKQEDIERNIRSLTALYNDNRGIDSFIRSVSESLAYQKALADYYNELVYGVYKDMRHKGD